MKTQLILYLLIFCTPVSVDEKRVLSLINKLSHTNDHIREYATQSLMNMGMEILPILQESYINAPYETKRRIKRIAEELYLTDKVGPGPAFLGIGLEYTGWVMDHRVPSEITALKVTDIYRYSSAERADIRIGDLIILLYDKNNKRIEGDMPKWIKKQRPGTTCRAGIMRGGEGIHIEQLIIARFSHEELSKIKPDVILHEDDPRILPEYAGIVISQDCLASNLHKGDIIISLDHKGLPKKGAQKVFDTWLQNMKEEQRMSFSMQVLRGGTFFFTDIVLNRPPPILKYKYDRKFSMKLMDAYAEFQEWWTISFPQEYKEYKFWRTN